MTSAKVSKRGARVFHLYKQVEERTFIKWSNSVAENGVQDEVR